MLFNQTCTSIRFIFFASMTKVKLYTIIDQTILLHV